MVARSGLRRKASKGGSAQGQEPLTQKRPLVAPGGQHCGRLLPSPHSQQPDANTYGTHLPAAQIAPVVHAAPQVPQLVESVCGFGAGAQTALRGGQR